MKEWVVFSKEKPGEPRGVIIWWPEWDEREARAWFKEHESQNPEHFYHGIALELVEFETNEERVKKECDRYRAALESIKCKLSITDVPNDDWVKTLHGEIFSLAAHALNYELAQPV